MQNFITKPPLKAPLDDGQRVDTAWAAWFDKAFQILFAQAQSGTTAQRPTVGLYVGRRYFDVTLGLPVFYDGTDWIDAAGNVV